MVEPTKEARNKEGDELRAQRSFSGSVHSSENSLQVSDDEDAATTRLNTWLNGGGSNEFASQLGNGSISAVTPLDPFVKANADLPSPFSKRHSEYGSERSLLSLDSFVEPGNFLDTGNNIGPSISLEPSALLTSPPLPSLSVGSPVNMFPMPPSPPLDLSMNPSSNAPPINTAAVGSSGILRQGESRRYDDAAAGRETIRSEALKNSGSTHEDDRPKPEYQRQRTVSWGEKPKPPEAVNAAPTKKVSPKLTPTRHVRGPSEFSLFSVLTDSDASEAESPVKLDDIIRMNPLETEAETLVMKIIEAQENTNRERANTGLLGNVPEDGVHVFLPQPPPLIETTSSKSEATASSKSRRDIKSPQSDRTRLNTVDSPTQNSPPSQLLSSTNSPPILATSANSNSRTGPSAVQNQRPPRPNLLRNVTMEHKLANLTEALAGFHNQTSHTNDSAHPTHFPGNAPHEDLVEVSAGEKLAQNANLIFRGRQKTEGRPAELGTEDVSNHSNGSGFNKLPLNRASSHWSKVKTAAAIIKPAAPPATVDLSAVPNVNGHPAVFSSGSVEDYKKTDVATTDQHPDDDMECGTAMHDNKIGSHTSHSDEASHRKSWRLLPKVLNTTAVRDFHVFVSQRRSDFVNYLRFLFLVGIPALGAAFILFYVVGNPPTGIVDFVLSGNGILVSKDGTIIDPLQPSVSWWLIFICIRQALTFSGAQLFQVIIIDFLCLSTRFSVNAFGNLLTLFIVQSRGWPFIAFMWGILNFALLHGNSRFANHWLFWQDFIGLMNEVNPSGGVTSNEWYIRILSISVCLGVVVAVKRLWLGLFLGKKTYANYAEDLTRLVDKMLILCEVAALAREIESEFARPFSLKRSLSVSQYGITRQEFDDMLLESDGDDGSSKSKNAKGLTTESKYQGGLIVDPTSNDIRRARLDQAQRAKITELLGAWEEPDAEGSAEENVSISGILQFRNSLAFLNNDYMFSIAWGETTTRDRMIIGSQEVFGKLMKRSALVDALKFDVLAAVAKQSDGTLNQEKLKRVIRLFRPDRDGNLSLLEFVKSVDVVYKEAKLLRASVLNSEKIDRAFEKALNVVFYTLVACIILAVVGLNPLTLIVSLTSVIVGFAFMVGSASSKMFEGWLFILVRRPYNIGDRIHISNVENETSPDGSAGWIVKDLTLYHTTAVYGNTGERATMSNGSLASSRIINMARSPKASVYVYIKFSTDVPYERIQIFEKALREFVKSRPREWANFNGFRATKFLADLGYIEYVVALTHREAWQSLITILESKAQVSSFCLELSKKLHMRYASPPLPVDLAIVGPREGPAVDSLVAKFAALEESSGYKEVAALFDARSG